jgi:hypothetical protein
MWCGAVVAALAGTSLPVSDLVDVLLIPDKGWEEGLGGTTTTLIVATSFAGALIAVAIGRLADYWVANKRMSELNKTSFLVRNFALTLTAYGFGLFVAVVVAFFILIPGSGD